MALIRYFVVDRERGDADGQMKNDPDLDQSLEIAEAVPIEAKEAARKAAS